MIPSLGTLNQPQWRLLLWKADGVFHDSIPGENGWGFVFEPSSSTPSTTRTSATPQHPFGRSTQMLASSLGRRTWRFHPLYQTRRHSFWSWGWSNSRLGLRHRFHLRLGMNKRRDNSPAFTRYDSTSPGSVVGAFLNSCYSLPLQERVSLISLLNLVGSGAPGNDAKVDETIAGLLKALDALCRIHGLTHQRLCLA